MQLPNGNIIKGVPDGTTKAALSAKLTANGIKIDSVPTAAPQKTSFLGDMWSNFKGGVGSAIDVGKNLTSSHPMVTPQSIPKTEALADKLFAGIEDPSISGMAKTAAKNIGSVKPSDVSGAVNEEFGRTTPGKALSAIGGINPLWNAAGTTMSRYINPAISKKTGINPENLQLMETVLAPAGLAKTGKGTTAPATLASRIDKNFSIIPSIGKLTEKQVERLKATPHLTAEQIKAISGDAYKTAEQKGGTFKPDISDKFLSGINDLIPKGEISKELAQNRPFMKLINDLQIVKGKPITLEDAQGIDEHLGDAADSHFQNGQMSKEGKKILDIQDKFRDSIDSAKEADIVGGKSGLDAWKNAKFYWSQAAKQRDIEKIITRASMMDNPAQAAKAGFRNLYMNEKRLRGFNKEERELIKKAADGSPLADWLRAWGSRLIPIGEIVGGGGFSSGVASQIMTTAARNAASRLQVSRANAIEKSISKDVQNRQQQSQLPNP